VQQESREEKQLILIRGPSKSARSESLSKVRRTSQVAIRGEGHHRLEKQQRHKRARMFVTTCQSQGHREEQG
jgi:hypothetical protein